jgi:hypothetical protein
VLVTSTIVDKAQLTLFASFDRVDFSVCKFTTGMSEEVFADNKKVTGLYPFPLPPELPVEVVVLLSLPLDDVPPPEA